MAKYINADALEKFIRDVRREMNPENYNSAGAFYATDRSLLNMEQIVHLMPAADVRENVKGEWVNCREKIEESFFTGSRCSACGYWKSMGIWNFCPNCGADMRGWSE